MFNQSQELVTPLEAPCFPLRSFIFRRNDENLALELKLRQPIEERTLLCDIEHILPEQALATEISQEEFDCFLKYFEVLLVAQSSTQEKVIAASNHIQQTLILKKLG